MEWGNDFEVVWIYLKLNKTRFVDFAFIWEKFAPLASGFNAFRVEIILLNYEILANYQITKQNNRKTAN